MIPTRADKNCGTMRGADLQRTCQISLIWFAGTGLMIFTPTKVSLLLFTWNAIFPSHDCWHYWKSSLIYSRGVDTSLAVMYPLLGIPKLSIGFHSSPWEHEVKVSNFLSSVIDQYYFHPGLTFLNPRTLGGLNRAKNNYYFTYGPGSSMCHLAINNAHY